MITKGKKYLITGATGIIGYSLCKRIISMGGQVVVMSRNKNKLKNLKRKYNEIEIVVGDICNQQIIRNVIKDVDGVFHLAAVADGMQAGKPIESVTTNVIGSMIVLQEASNVDFVLGISSDKVVQVSGSYGATKFLMEKLFNQFEEMNPKVKYRVIRLGNVIYSADSVLYRWKSLIEKCKEVIVTDKKATRFFMTSEKSVDLIMNCLEKAKNSKPYFEDMKSASIGNLLKAMTNKYAPKNCKLSIKKIGLSPNENLHEKISEDGPYTNEIEQYTVKELEEMI
tara:strand:- start:28 stop:873 length:846 start_codon:yes stop_codon:yes gene_type:complete